MAIPVIHEDTWPVDRPPVLDGASCQALTNAVNACLKDACALLLFSRLRNYACVASWSPLVLQEHLCCVHERQLLAPLYEEKQGLLARGAQLSFLFSVIVSRRHWPNTPVNSPEAFSQLEAVVRAALKAAGRKSTSQLHVLHLQPIQDAIASGLCDWIWLVNGEGPIQDWRAKPTQEPPDMVRVDVETPTSRDWAPGFIVRKHQVGTRGLQSVAHALNACAKPGGAAISNP